MTLKDRAKLTTYPHLRDGARPTFDYEMLTSQLSYEPDRGFELELPVGSWHERFREQSRPMLDELEAFSDPRQTTYRSYVELQHARELTIDAIYTRIEESNYDRRLSPRALEHLDLVIFPLRYVFHGFQMIAAYFGELAPSSRIAVAAMFQAADELRRIQRIAQRMALVRRAHPNLGSHSRAIFEGALEWQPMRRLVEELLVTYNLGHAFVALNLCVKPIVDELVLVGAAEVAKKAGDVLLPDIFATLHEDAEWQRSWSLALAKSAHDTFEENRTLLPELIERYLARTETATAPLAEGFGGSTFRANTFERWRDRLRKGGL